MYAKAGAAQHEIDDEVITRAFKVDQAAWLVQRRIVAVNIRCAELDGGRKKKKEPKKKHIRKAKKPKVLEAAGHTIKMVQGRMKCVQCLLSWSVRQALGSAAVKKCAGPPVCNIVRANAPTFLSKETEWKIGNTVLDSCHKLGWL